MRTIKELLTILKENIEKHGVDTGLCYENCVLYNKGLISFEERTIIKNWIHKHKPLPIINQKSWCHYQKTNYYWPEGQSKPRIEFLNKHIKLL
jgi:hypothetical protein